MDKTIKEVLNKIEEKGFKAFIVGGYVRDLILGIESFDIDICTDALPKDIKNIFNITNDSSKYGSINFKLNGYSFDITTFRKEIEYLNRRPIKIEYIKDIYIDVLRRDFTINTICLDKDSRFIDYLDGKKDINNKLIKLIGDKNRLKEDPLRILRAIRFATILDFELDIDLQDGIYLYKDLVNTLSKNRIKNELDKILLSKNYKKGLDLLKKFGLLEYLKIEYSDIVFVNDLCGMYAQLKIEDLPFNKNEFKNISDIKEILNIKEINNFTLFNYGLYINSVCADIMNINRNTVNEMYDKLPIHQKSDLEINALEIKETLKLDDFNNINNIINILIKKVLNNEIKNDKIEIISYLERMSVNEC